MSKEQILDRLDELEAERASIIAEQEAINNDMSYVLSEESTKADEFMHQIARRKGAVNQRMRSWEAKMQEVERAVDELAA